MEFINVQNKTEGSQIRTKSLHQIVREMISVYF